VLFLACLLGTFPARANKPAPGPAVAAEKQQPKPAPPDDPDRRRVVEAQHLRDDADLARAAYEKSNRPGPVPDKAKQQFDEIVTKYRTAINHDPYGPVATYCRQRLAGAYNYTGDFAAGLRVLTEAVTLASTPLELVEADHAVGLQCLQAMHKPGEALNWFQRAHAQLKEIHDDGQRAKWTTAVDQGIARCRAELAK
jgi:tetratricopeptide (TPR) repeat protein